MNIHITTTNKEIKEDEIQNIVLRKLTFKERLKLLFFSLFGNELIFNNFSNYKIKR